MSELSRFLNRSKPLPLCVIQFPNGRWGFVGSGPVELFWTGPADAIKAGLSVGMGFVRHRGVKSATWATRDEAMAAADVIGATVTS